MLYPVIVCGGAGSRLWPMSREQSPKPFLPLRDGESLLEKTLRRALELKGVEEVVTVTNRELFFATEDTYQHANVGNRRLSYILEPFGRNTAAAIASAALDLQSRHGPNAIMLVLPADHLIEQEGRFATAVDQATELAQQNLLVTFGIKPLYPETGFGYIEVGEALGHGRRVERFVEKPTTDIAREYVAAGNYFWNSGMFCFQAGVFLSELSKHAPEVFGAVQTAFEQARRNDNRLMLDAAQFADIPDISVDYAVMEHSPLVATIPCDIGWNDIGSWVAMSELTPPDKDNNRLIGEVLTHAASQNFVHSQERLTALVGVRDLLVVDTSDALLVAHKDHAQDVKHIVSRLKQDGHDAHLIHKTVHRPWGAYTTIEEGDRFKIKRIVVKPGAALSLQIHHHRNEHWVVVSGVAKVTNGEQEVLLNGNESTFIPAGHKHRLANPGLIDLILIEVQSGDYLGEDDIVRLEDHYGRS